MGRIKTKKLKNITKKLVANHEEKLAENFEENKTIVGTLANFRSKKLRNVVAGYATRLKKRAVKNQI